MPSFRTATSSCTRPTAKRSSSLLARLLLRQSRKPPRNSDDRRVRASRRRVAAALIAWVTLSQRFYRQPFGDRGAIWLWLLAVGLDVVVYLAVVGGYAAVGGAPRAHTATFVGSILAGVTVPLALRSPIRSATVRGTPRSVGVTYVYDYLRAVVEDPLDGKLADLRRQEERQLAVQLAAQGWTAKGLLEE